MALFSRRVDPPAELLRMLDPEEQVVSWADTADGPVVITRLGLWWPFPDGQRRVGWHLVDKAVWRDGVLTLTEAEVVDGLMLVERRPVALELTEPRDVPAALRKRVDASVVRSEVLPVPRGAARFVARRVPGQDGITWFARLEPGTPDLPGVRASVRAIANQLQASWQAERADQ